MQPIFVKLLRIQQFPLIIFLSFLECYYDLKVICRVAATASIRTISTRKAELLTAEQQQSRKSLNSSN